MEEAKFEDFKPVEGHAGYLMRDLGDSVGEGEWVQLVRDDGWGFGAIPRNQVAMTIKNDKIPPTGITLKDIFIPLEQ